MSRPNIYTEMKFDLACKKQQLLEFAEKIERKIVDISNPDVEHEFNQLRNEAQILYNQIYAKTVKQVHYRDYDPTCSRTKTAIIMEAIEQNSQKVRKTT